MYDVPKKCVLLKPCHLPQEERCDLKIVHDLDSV